MGLSLQQRQLLYNCIGQDYELEATKLKHVSLNLFYFQHSTRKAATLKSIVKAHSCQEQMQCNSLACVGWECIVLLLSGIMCGLDIDV